MLVLTRRIGETIVIGNNREASFTVLGVKGEQVRVAVEASKEIPVHRQEVFDRIQEAKSKKNEAS